MGNVKYLSLIDDNNNLELVEVLCSFYLEEYHSNYIIYSLNKNSNNSKNIIHIGKLIAVDNKDYLFNIDNYGEWSKLRDIINRINDFGLEGDINE